MQKNLWKQEKGTIIFYVYFCFVYLNTVIVKHQSVNFWLINLWNYPEYREVQNRQSSVRISQRDIEV